MPPTRVLSWPVQREGLCPLKSKSVPAFGQDLEKGSDIHKQPSDACMMVPKVMALSLKDIVLHEMKNDSRYKDLLSVHRPKQLARYAVAEALTCNIQPRFLVLSGLQPETSRVTTPSSSTLGWCLPNKWLYPLCDLTGCTLSIELAHYPCFFIAAKSSRVSRASRACVLRLSNFLESDLSKTGHNIDLQEGDIIKH